MKSYLRPKRRRWGFTQRELALLVGVKSSAVISRIEGLRRTPSLAAVLTFAVIFSATPSDLFPAVMMEIQQSLHKRASELYDELQGDTSKTTRMKLDFLEALLARLEEETPRDV